MDIFMQYLPMILCLWGPVLLSAVAFAILRRRKQSRAVERICGILSAIMLLLGAILPCYILAVGGGPELILALLLLPLLIMLI